ncbi:MAG: erythromycin esterase family protein [Bacteroidota bacterium]
MKIQLFPIGMALCLLTACQQTDLPAPEPAEPVEFSCELSTSHQAVADELSATFAKVFQPVDPTVADPALDPLVEYLGEASIVGMGEATHGTREFFQFKDLLFRRLVTEQGFKAIVFEIPWGNAMIVNDYVLHGIGNANDAVDQTWYWVYDTQEVRDLVIWMRNYNENLPEVDRIWFVGNDPQGPDFQAEVDRIWKYLQVVDPDSAHSVIAQYKDLPTGDLFDVAGVNADLHAANQEASQWVLDYLSRNETNFVAASNQQSFDVIQMAAQVIQSRENMYWVGDFGIGRDQLMAVYTQRWQELFSTDLAEAKVAAWAHNNHVSNISGWMGQFLKDSYGAAYQIVGFSFTRGAFNAFLADGNFAFLGPVQEQSITDPICPSANHLFGEVQGDQFYLILGELSGPARNFLYGSQPFTQCGAGFNVQYQSNYTLQQNQGDRNDVLVHFDQTAASLLR